jgi:lambda family phage portal protein
MNIFKKLFGQNDKPEVKTEITTSKRSFAGAKFSEMNDISLSLSLNRDIQAGLSTLRGRCRQLAQNNSYATKAISLWTNNIVGPNGVELRVNAKKSSGILDKNVNDIIETAYKNWSKHGKCEVTGQLSFVKVQDLIIESLAKDGEALVIFRRGSEFGKFNFQLELVQIDQLDENYYGVTPENNVIFQGVELNKYMRPVAYWLWEHNRNDPAINHAAQNRRLRIAAEDCIHIVDRHAIGQVRGYPWIATSLLALHHIDTYKLTELETARVASLRSVFYTLPANPEGISAEALDKIDAAVSRKLTAGSIEILPEGMDVKNIDWNTPNAGMPEFVKCQLKGIAAGLNLSYATLANDLESINFSSAKYAALEDQATYSKKQNWFIDSFVNLVYEEWLNVQLNYSTLPLKSSNLDKYTNVVWQAKSWNSVSLIETARAATMYSALGVKSKQTICSELGLDYSSQITQIAAEEKELILLGVSLAPPLELAKLEILQDQYENDKNDKETV